MEALFKQRHRRSPLRRPGPRLRMVAVMHAMRTACLVCAALYSHVSCYSATASPRTPLLFPPLQPTAAATPALLLPAVAALPPRRPQPRLRRAAASHLSLRSDTPEASRAPLPADSCPLPEASTLELFRFIIPTLTGWLSSEVMTVIEPGGDTGGEGGSGEAGGETVGEETGEGRAGGGTAGGGQDTAGRGLRASLRSPLLLRGWPSLQRLLSFVSFAGPMAFVLFGKVACYNAMTLAATSGGVITLAAHQVLVSVFFLGCEFGDAVSQAAQAYLPACFPAPPAQSPRQPPPLAPPAARRLSVRLMRLAAAMGLAVAGAALVVVTRAPALFTNSPEVVAGMRGAAPLLAAALSMHACTVGTEGLLIGSRQLGFLVKAYAANIAIFLSLLLLIARRGMGLNAVWSALVMFQLVRLFTFGRRGFTSGLLRLQ